MIQNLRKRRHFRGRHYSKKYDTQIILSNGKTVSYSANIGNFALRIAKKQDEIWSLYHQINDGKLSDLSGMDLSRYVFRDLDLSGVNFDGATLCSSDFTNVKNFERALGLESVILKKDITDHLPMIGLTDTQKDYFAQLRMNEFYLRN